MYKTFIGLLKHYKAEEETICQIIGFKFQSLHQQQQLQAKTRKNEADLTINELNADHISMDSLYTVTSYLLKYKMIDMDLLMSHLYPNEQLILQFYKEEFEAARQYAKKLTIINLSASDNPPVVNSSSSSSSSNNPPNQMDIQQADDKINIQYLTQQTIQLNKLDNQKVYLIKSLIEIGDYTTALKLIEKLPQWYLAIYTDITIAICKSIDTDYIDPMYKKYNSLSKHLSDKYSEKKQSPLRKSNNKDLADMSVQDNEEENDQDSGDMFSTFVDLVLPILSALGPSVSNNTILFTKLIRICVAFLDIKKFSINPMNSSLSSSSNENVHDKEMSDSTESLSNGNESSQQQFAGDYSQLKILKSLSKNETNFYNQIYNILNEIIFPSLSMISMNPCLAIELWNLLKHFPYEMRYHLYNNWRVNTYKHFPQLIRTKADCQEKIKYLLKRLTKENVKIHGRQIGKLSHNNPIIVCDYILTQIQRYDNFILPVVDSLKFMTPLSYDVLSYCIIVAISDAEKDKMKHDSTHISTWLQSVATFCALVFKKYPIELIAMIQYVINQLKNRKSYDLLILQEIVQKMCGIEVLSEVNDLQLEAMAGGDILRQEAGYFNPIRNIKKCALRLKEALADHGLILPLCILLSQQRDFIVYADQAEREREMPTEKRHLKLTGSFYDQCQDSLVQFSQFLSSTLTTEEYIHIFPQIDELVNEYHVSTEVAFFLSRPMYAHHIQSKYEELRKQDRNLVKSSEPNNKPTKTQRYLESIDAVMQPVIEVARSKLHPAKIWEDMSPLFYTTFWTLSMSDCYVPLQAYDKQKLSLKQKLNALDDNQELTSNKKKKEKEKIIIMLEKLAEEEKTQRDHVTHVKARFEKEKDHWFPQKSKTKNETITVFLQFCIFSRCLFTQIDAYYCAKFIQIIHSLKTPNFSTIICYDRIFSDISYSIASLTENEARRYGRFLYGLLETVMNWHADSAVFDNECAQFPGFLTVFRNALNSSPSAVNNKQEQLDYENFRHVCHKWHYKLTKSFIVCLESKEYLQMRNSLIILTKISPHYPKLTGFSSALEKRVEIIKKDEKDKRQDIYTLANAYLGQLKIRKSQMVDESKFHLKEASSSNQDTTSVTRNPDGSNKGSKVSSSSTSVNKLADASKFKQPSSKQPPPQQQQQTSSTSTTAPATITVQTNGTSSKSSSVASSQQQSSQSKSIIDSKTVNTKSVSSTSNSKENLNPSSAAETTSSNLANSTVIAANGISSSTSTSQSKDDHVKTNGSSSSNSKSNGSSKRSASSNSSSNRSSPTSSSSSSQRHEQLAPLTTATSNSSTITNTTTSTTTTANNTTKAEYSPTSSVSSDEWPCSSPKRQNNETTTTSNGNKIHSNNSTNHHHQPASKNSHSRSSSPINKTNTHHVSSTTSSNSASTNSHRSSSTSSDKSKRSKNTDVDPATLTSNGNSNKNGHDSSSKRKSSRERDRSDRSDTTKSERDSKDTKKEQRKREHSTDLLGVDVQHKRSKSDENKKKSEATSTATATAPQNTANSSQPSLSQSSNSSSESRSKRGSKSKHESSSYKDDHQVLNSSSTSSSSNQVLAASNSSVTSTGTGSSSSKSHRSSGEDRRSFSNHDKNSSYYNKEKK
jgi:THO complex subunit 2